MTMNKKLSYCCSAAYGITFGVSVQWISISGSGICFKWQFIPACVGILGLAIAAAILNDRDLEPKRK